MHIYLWPGMIIQQQSRFGLYITIISVPTGTCLLIFCLVLGSSILRKAPCSASHGTAFGCLCFGGFKYPISTSPNFLYRRQEIWRIGCLLLETWHYTSSGFISHRSLGFLHFNACSAQFRICTEYTSHESCLGPPKTVRTMRSIWPDTYQQNSHCTEIDWRYYSCCLSIFAFD